MNPDTDDGSYGMDLRDRAIGGIAVVEFCIRQIERELADATNYDRTGDQT